MKQKPQTQKRKKPKHRGSIRTPRRVDYLLTGLSAALADPDVRDHVALVGDLFPRRRGKKVATEQLARALAARHPTTGKLLRARVNTGTRSEGGSRVSNVCHGFDIGLSVAKSVSVVALLLEDDTVRDASFDAMRHTAQWLTRQMDRRLRKGGQNATVATGASAAFLLPEKTGRDGQPHLHAHVIIPNLTIIEGAGKKKYCAGHFRRITRLAMTAQRRMNNRLFQRLHKAGYAVNLVDGVCHLPSVSPELCARLSTVSARLKAPGTSEGAPVRRSTRRDVRRREDQYLKDRPKKVLRPLVEWRKQWAQEVGLESLKAAKKNYRAVRFQRPPESVGVSRELADILTLAPAPAISVAAHRQSPAVDDALEERRAAVPEFRSMGIALRARLEREVPAETRNQIVELDYSCPESQPDLVEHTEALRTLLRIIFPRILVHQKFTTAKSPGFVVMGAASGQLDFSRVVSATVTALDTELGQAHVRANWGSVLRWLHAELASRVPEPSMPSRRVRKTTKIEPAKLPTKTPSQPTAAVPVLPVVEMPPAMPSVEPEVEMLP